MSIYSGPSVSASLLAAVYDGAQATAADRLTKSDSLTNTALNYLNGIPITSPFRISGSVQLPVPPTLEGFNSAELNALFLSTADNVKQLIGGGLSKFYTDFFPLGTELGLAQNWIVQAFAGGTGIPVAVEAQIWERDRSRVRRDSYRAEDEAIASWAVRGYPLPPGALMGQLETIRQDARDKVAQASRDTAIKQVDVQIENIRFAVEKAIDLRKSAIQAAGEYIRTLALGPQLGIQLATAVVDAKAKLAAALATFYSAQIAAAELPVKVAIAETNANIEVVRINTGSINTAIEARVKVVQAAAQAAGTQASAALNALSAQASFSGSETS